MSNGSDGPRKLAVVVGDGARCWLELGVLELMGDDGGVTQPEIGLAETLPSGAAGAHATSQRPAARLVSVRIKLGPSALTAVDARPASDETPGPRLCRGLTFA